MRTVILILTLSALCFAQQPPAKKKVLRESDLPRFTYPFKGQIVDLLQADDQTFNGFASKVRIDLQSIFDGYEIEDKSTLRTLLEARLSFEELAGENQQGLKTIETIRALEEKPDAKLMSSITDEAYLQARIDSRAVNGPAYDKAFQQRFSDLVTPLPWNLVQDRVKNVKGSVEAVTPNLLVGMMSANIQPAIDKSGYIDNQTAWQLVGARYYLRFVLPLKTEILTVLRPYIAAHSVMKPDIWQARDVTLTADQKLNPVLMGIWDSGVDTDIFKDQLYTDPNPGWHDPHGMAFADQGGHSTSLVLPLSSALQSQYPSYVPILKGFSDQSSGVESPEAAALRQKLSTMSAKEATDMQKSLKLISPYSHGTHVAGIAVRGNPAARLVVLRFNDQLSDLTFAPTPEWAHLMADNFRQIGEYCRTHHVRVVNMSWGDEPGEFENWLSKTGGGQDAATRTEQALQLFQIWKAGISDAIKSASDTLFICAAGNSNSNPGFTEDVPASLHLPNLIAVGAVNQAGDETSFTSYGESVVLDANGYNVESYVPGGSRLKLSGTSMASPNVANLAGKLLALDPALTPEQVIILMKEGATTSEDGRRHLINEKRSVELLKKTENR